VILPEGTPIEVSLDADLRSGGSKAGETVPFHVVSDVASPGHIVLVTAGSPAYGQVIRSARRGLFGKAGKLEISCDYVVAPDGTHVPLRSQAMGSSGRNNTAAMAATTILLSPVGLLIHGRDAVLHRGRRFTLYVDKETPLLPATALAGRAPAPGKSVFVLKDGSRVVGSLISYDGFFYRVATDEETRTLRATDVQSVSLLAPAGTPPSGPEQAPARAPERDGQSPPVVPTPPPAPSGEETRVTTPTR
jgi:hypothetical protein